MSNVPALQGADRWSPHHVVIKPGPGRVRVGDKSFMPFARISHDPAVMVGSINERILDAYPQLEPADIDEVLAFEHHLLS